MNTSISAKIALVWLAASLAACQTDPGAGVSACNQTQNVVERSKALRSDSVALVGAELRGSGFLGRKAGRVAVNGLRTSRTPTGTMLVEATLRNCTDRELALEARAHFLDARELPVEHPTAWRRLALAPLSLVGFEDSSAGTSEVERFYIEVREAR
jgi:hypothetical protein